MSDPYIGEIRMFAGNFAPRGWAFCDGSLVSIAQYDVLFTLIGTTYGGDGQTTYALPNLVSRIPFGQASAQPIGEAGGAETVTLSTSQLPPHSHAAQASRETATHDAPADRVWASWADGQYSTAAPDATMDPSAVSVAGGNQPHENLPPYLAVSFIIAMEGIFPSQNRAATEDGQ